MGKGRDCNANKLTVNEASPFLAFGERKFWRRHTRHCVLLAHTSSGKVTACTEQKKQHGAVLLFWLRPTIFGDSASGDRRAGDRRRDFFNFPRGSPAPARVPCQLGDPCVLPSSPCPSLPRSDAPLLRISHPSGAHRPFTQPPHRLLHASPLLPKRRVPLPNTMHQRVFFMQQPPPRLTCRAPWSASCMRPWSYRHPPPARRAPTGLASRGPSSPPQT